MTCAARWIGLQVATLLMTIPFLGGCGPDGPEVAYVEGTVSLDGQPLNGAQITFTPTGGGRPSGGTTNGQGWYELIYTEEVNGALPGEHRVEISTYSSGDPGQGQKPVPEKLPARYNVRTELKETVESDDNVIDFELTSDGKIVTPRD